MDLLRLAYASAPVARRKLKKSEDKPDISAAGGVVVRRDDRRNRVAVVHRPKYMDWSLPKGKLEKGEGWKEAALREVEEETGFRCRVLVELPPVSYLDRKTRSKLVRYWLMRVLTGEFSPGPEVDELRWLDPEGAQELLSYEHDAELVREAVGAS